MASRQSVSSILKPSKVRAPLKEIEPIDQDDDENTVTIAKRKVSFSGMNKIKMYNTGATSLTVHQAPMIDEQFSILSDSSNTEKPKLSEKFEKSDGQVTFESTNYTNVENNSHLIIEYESPIDNMEMTEALPGKIFSETIYTFDNDLEHFDYNLNDSENNMEFTEAVKVGTIITTTNESSIDETLNNDDEKELETEFDFQPSTPVSDMCAKNTSNTTFCFSNIDLTYATKKSYSMDLTCMTDRQMSEENNESVASYGIEENSNDNYQIIQNNILYNETMEKNNCSDNQIINCGFKKSFNHHDIIEQLSLSVISMDIDPTLEGIECDSNYVDVNNSKLLATEQKNLIVPITTEKNINKSVTVEEKLLEKMLHAHTPTPEQTKFYENDDSTIVVEKSLKKNYSRKTMMIHTDPLLVAQKNFAENEDNSDTSVIVEKNQQNKYSRKSVALASGFSQSLLFGNETLSDTSMYSKSLEKEDALDTYVKAEKIQQKNSRKSVGPASIIPQNESPEDSVCNISLMSEENNEVLFANNLSLISDNGNTQQLDVCTLTHNEDQLDLKSGNESVFNISDDLNSRSRKISRKSVGPTYLKDHLLNNGNIQRLDVSTSIHNEEQSVSKGEHQSVLLDEISDGDFNSPFRKKSRKSIVPTHLTEHFVEHTKILIDSNEIKLGTANEGNKFDILETESKMDSSLALESKTENITNISSKDVSMTLSSSFPSDDKSFLKKILKSPVNEDTEFSGLNSGTFENESKETNISLNKKNKYEEDKGNMNMSTNELKNNETNLNELLKEIDRKNEEKTNNEIVKIDDDTSGINNISNLTNSLSHVTDMVIANEICIEKDISNMSISDKTHELITKSFTEYRKRNYSHIDCLPLSCSSFTSKTNVHNSMNEDFSKNDFVKEIPTENNIAKEDLINDDCVIENGIEVDMIKRGPVKEHLSSVVLDFLTRWNDKFVEKNLVLHKCTNSEWIFNVLDNNIILLIKYAPILNENSFLKVKNISFTTRTITQNEITMFGINWILSKYNSKVYKQICFTSRDIELLLKSMIEDVQFISMVMKNLTFVRDVYFVTFKDNKAQFVLHSMNDLLMASIEISLSNIHKLSVKDITVNCVFGYFDMKILDKIMESVTKDHMVVQSVIEKLLHSNPSYNV